MTYEVPKPTADEVRAYRDATGAGMMEAKHILRVARIRAVLSDLLAHGTLEDKIDFLLERYEESL